MARQKPVRPRPPPPPSAREARLLEETRAELDRGLIRLRATVERVRHANGMIQLSDRSWIFPPDPDFIGPPDPKMTRADGRSIHLQEWKTGTEPARTAGG